MNRRTFRIACAGACLLVVAGSYAGYISLMRRSHGQRNCEHNLRQIGLVILQYASENRGRLPDTLETVARSGDLSSAAFVCPLAGDAEHADPTTQAVAERLTGDGHLSYIYTGRGLTTAAVTSDTILAFEPLTIHGDGMNVLFGDGRVGFMDARRGKVVAARAAAGLSPVLPPPLTPP